jgi:hypothetical protein
MPALRHVTIEAIDPPRFESVLSLGEFEALRDLIADGARDLHGQVIWKANSTAKGGGGVEMLRPLLGPFPGHRRRRQMGGDLRRSRFLRDHKAHP